MIGLWSLFPLYFYVEIKKKSLNLNSVIVLDLLKKKFVLNPLYLRKEIWVHIHS